MTKEIPRRRTLVGIGSALTVGLAGCSDGGDGDSGEDDGGGDSGEDDGGGGNGSGNGSGGSGREFTLKTSGGTDYQSLVVTIDSLTLKPGSTGGEPGTIEVGQSADISQGSMNDGLTVAENLRAPYGTYETLDVSVTVDEAVDSNGSSVNLSGGTMTQALRGPPDDEPAEIKDEYGGFDSTLTLFFYVGNGTLRLSGYSFVALF